MGQNQGMLMLGELLEKKKNPFSWGANTLTKSFEEGQ